MNPPLVFALNLPCGKFPLCRSKPVRGFFSSAISISAIPGHFPWGASLRKAPEMQYGLSFTVET